MVDPLPSLRRCRAWLVLLVGLSGCSSAESDVDSSSLSPANLVTVPAGGVVTLKGKPLAKAVITFLPPHGPGVGLGETDQDGRFELSSMGRKGIPPGTYKVSISYLVSDRGVPQGIGPRSSQAPGPGMLSAKEQLPPEYSDLGRSQLARTVGAKGGQFEFDVPVDLPVASATSSEKKDESGKTNDPKATESKAVAKPPDPKASEPKHE